jgi:hypothetical protein
MASKKKRENKSVERIPFGEMAVRKGYCTREEVEEALRVQRKLGERGRPRPLIGIILVQHGFITTGQLIDVLRTYQDEHEAHD